MDFEPYDKDGKPRRYVGMHRPPLEKVLKDSSGHTIYVGVDGRPLYGSVDVRKAWMEGDWDRPLYDDGGSRFWRKMYIDDVCPNVEEIAALDAHAND